MLAAEPHDGLTRQERDLEAARHHIGPLSFVAAMTSLVE